MNNSKVDTWVTILANTNNVCYIFLHVRQKIIFFCFWIIRLTAPVNKIVPLFCLKMHFKGVKILFLYIFYNKNHYDTLNNNDK